MSLMGSGSISAGNLFKDPDPNSEKQIIGEDCCRQWWNIWDSLPPGDDLSKLPVCRLRFAAPITLTNNCDPAKIKASAEALNQRYGTELSASKVAKYGGDRVKALEAYIGEMCANSKKLPGWNTDKHGDDIRDLCTVFGETTASCDYKYLIQAGELFCQTDPLDKNGCISKEKDTLWSYLQKYSKDRSLWDMWDDYVKIKEGICYQTNAQPCYKLARPEYSDTTWRLARDADPDQTRGNVYNDLPGVKLLDTARENVCQEVRGNGCGNYGKCVDATWELIQTVPYWAQNPEEAHLVLFKLCQSVSADVCPLNAPKDCFGNGKVEVTDDMIRMGTLLGIKFDKEYKDEAWVAEMQYLYDLTEPVVPKPYSLDVLEKFIQTHTGITSNEWHSFIKEQGQNPYWIGGPDAAGNFLSGGGESRGSDFAKGLEEWLRGLYQAIRIVWRGGSIAPTNDPTSVYADFRCWAGSRYVPEGRQSNNPNLYFEKTRAVRNFFWGNGTECVDSTRETKSCQGSQISLTEQNWCTLNNVPNRECKAETRKRFGCDFLSIEDATCKGLGFAEGFGKACYDKQNEMGWELDCVPDLNNVFGTMDNPCANGPSNNGKGWLKWALIGGGVLVVSVVGLKVWRG